MKSEDLLLTLAVVAVIVSAIGAGVTYYSIDSFKETWFTGFATTTDNATVNLTVITSVAINFTTDNINFGAGKVDLGADNATLVTTGANNTGGNWTNVTQGFVLENIGNVNASIYLMTGKTAATFLGGTNPQYQYNLTNKEAISCVNASGFLPSELGLWRDVNNTFLGSNRGQEGTYICSNFSFQDALDEIRIDLKLVVPSDSFTGSLGDIMTASAYQA